MHPNEFHSQCHLSTRQFWPKSIDAIDLLATMYCTVHTVVVKIFFTTKKHKFYSLLKILFSFEPFILKFVSFTKFWNNCWQFQNTNYKHTVYSIKSVNKSAFYNDLRVIAFYYLFKFNSMNVLWRAYGYSASWNVLFIILQSIKSYRGLCVDVAIIHGNDMQMQWLRSEQIRFQVSSVGWTIFWKTMQLNCAKLIDVHSNARLISFSNVLKSSEKKNLCREKELQYI